MDTPQFNTTSISEQDARLEFQTKTSATEFEQLALPLTDNERVASRRQLDKLHPGNRFRLMFGQPLLPETQASGMFHSSH